MNKLLGCKGIIFSPDFIKLKELIRILKSCRQFYKALKIGNILLYRYGISILSEIKNSCDIPIICDFKLMDIPDVAEEIIHMGVMNGMDGAMIWGLAGEETISRCIHTFPETMIFLLTEYTHSSEPINPFSGNEAARMALDNNAFGIQAPGTRPKRIVELREIVGENMTIMCCGIGYQGTPYGVAVEHGADFEIIGRKIYQSRDPFGESENAFNAIRAACTRKTTLGDNFF